jgi:hypothetical protein
MARVQFPEKQQIFLFSSVSSPALGPNQSPVWVHSFPGGKAARMRIWPLTSIWYQGQGGWSYASTPPYVFMAWCLIMYSENFTWTELNWTSVLGRFETPPTWTARSPYLYSPGTAWSGYIPRHWVPFLSPPTTHRAMVEVLNPASLAWTPQ